MDKDWLGLSILKFQRRGRVAANKMLVNLPSWQRGRVAATPQNP